MLLCCSVAIGAQNWDRRGAEAALEDARRMRSGILESADAPRDLYLRCISSYRQVLLKDPHFGGADDALYESAELYQKLGEKVGDAGAYKEAVKLYRYLISDYPASPLLPNALLQLGNLYSGPVGDPAAAREAFQTLLTRFKSSAAASSLDDGRAQRRQADRPAVVQNIRHWTTKDYTRVIIDLEGEAKYDRTELSNPDRVFFDLHNSTVLNDLLNRSITVEDKYLKRVRVGQNRRDVVRVVLDLAEARGYSVSEMRNPFRIVIDIHSRQGLATAPPPAKTASPAPRPPAAAPLASRTDPPLKVDASPAPSRTAQGTVQLAADVVEGTRIEGVVEGARVETLELGGPVPAVERGSTPVMPGALPAPAVRKSEPPPANPNAAKPSAVQPAAAKAAADVPAPPPLPAPKAALPTSRGDRTLTRMLGLKIGRIVIDPGHGGHDTGTIGKGGLREKDLVLDVALELRKLLEEDLGAEVILTRESDVYLSLEERTSIANERKADLFLSIHANSSSNRNISGVETYYLSFAKTAAEREVAARENASSAGNISDLQSLVTKIAQADKSTESRELASIIQKRLFGGVQKLSPATRDRGVRSAPFVVLIGAQMPSVLAELAFISNPRDEKLLRKESNRQRLAKALYSGIEGYVQTLGGDVAQSRSGSTN